MMGEETLDRVDIVRWCRRDTEGVRRQGQPLDREERDG